MESAYRRFIVKLREFLLLDEGTPWGATIRDYLGVVFFAGLFVGAALILAAKAMGYL